VIVIIGILTTIAVPNFLVSVRRAKQKSIMKDITSISTAITDYFTDNGTVPAQDGTYSASTDFYRALSPFYIKVLPQNDKWGKGFRVWTGRNIIGNYGIFKASEDDFLIASFGRDDIQDSFFFNSESPDEGYFTLSKMSDFNKDLVMFNGSWIRRTKRPAGRGC